MKELNDSHEYKFLVSPEDDGIRVENFLASQIIALSRMHIANLINKGACLVNKEMASLKQQIKVGDEIILHIEEIPSNSMTPENIPLEIVYEDETILIVVKPAGMLVHPTLSVKSGTLLNALSYHLNKERESDFIRPGLVHRLDRATSGLMVITKTQEALSLLSTHFQRKLVKKIYLAIIGGVVVKDKMTIIAPIGRDESKHPHWRVLDSGKEAETRLIVLGRKENSTLVELEPVTGRTNQLRIHCAHIGHAIVGDDLHGNIPFKRLCLHAAKLSFFHPVSNEKVEFVSPLPKEIKEAFK